MDIIVMALDSMHLHNFFCQTVAGENVITFGVDNSSSVDVDNKKKDVLRSDKNIWWYYNNSRG